jgi:hypothetical protein
MSRRNLDEGNEDVRPIGDITRAIFTAYGLKYRDEEGQLRCIVWRIRKKIQEASGNPDLPNLIVTEWGVGHGLLTSPVRTGQPSCVPAGQDLVVTRGSLPHHFTVEGTLPHIPFWGAVWLAVRVNDKVWPKEEIPQSESSWHLDLVLDENTDEPFELVLLKVGPFGNRRIRRWFARGDEGNHFPGLSAKDFPRL